MEEIKKNGDFVASETFRVYVPGHHREKTTSWYDDNLSYVDVKFLSNLDFYHYTCDEMEKALVKYLYERGIERPGYQVLTSQPGHGIYSVYTKALITKSDDSETTYESHRFGKVKTFTYENKIEPVFDFYEDLKTIEEWFNCKVKSLFSFDEECGYGEATYRRAETIRLFDDRAIRVFIVDGDIKIIKETDKDEVLLGVNTVFSHKKVINHSGLEWFHEIAEIIRSGAMKKSEKDLRRCSKFMKQNSIATKKWYDEFIDEKIKKLIDQMQSHVLDVILCKGKYEDLPEKCHIEGDLRYIKRMIPASDMYSEKKEEDYEFLFIYPAFKTYCNRFYKARRANLQTKEITKPEE